MLITPLAFTIFTLPKPFNAPFDVIQRNAIQSWRLLTPKPEIVLLGNEHGVEEIAKEFELKHVDVPIRLTSVGGIDISHVLELGREHATNDILVFANCDIIFMDDLTLAIARLAGMLSKFVASGERWQLELNDSMSFIGNWRELLREQVFKLDLRPGKIAMDYFIFNRDINLLNKPFNIGYPWWDPWILYNVRFNLHMPVVDISSCAIAIHQEHPRSKTANEVLYQFNVQQCGEQWCHIGGATHLLTPTGELIDRLTY